MKGHHARERFAKKFVGVQGKGKGKAKAMASGGRASASGGIGGRRGGDDAQVLWKRDGEVRDLERAETRDDDAALPLLENSPSGSMSAP